VPLVLVEALAAGCRVVATEAGTGVRDVLEHGAAGRIVPVDDVSRLASAIGAAVTDVRSGAAPDTEVVDTIVRRHDPDVVLDAWVGLLGRQVGGVARRS
jgi:glycosyltransferase involved in cell wall biosynthesis